MSRIASYFTAGHLPALVSTYYNQLDLLDLLGNSDNEAVRAFASDERDRFEEMGFHEATAMRISEMVTLASQLGYVPPPQPEVRSETFAWLEGKVPAAV